MVFEKNSFVKFARTGMREVNIFNLLATASCKNVLILFPAFGWVNLKFSVLDFSFYSLENSWNFVLSQ